MILIIMFIIANGRASKRSTSGYLLVTLVGLSALLVGGLSAPAQDHATDAKKVKAPYSALSVKPTSLAFKKINLTKSPTPVSASFTVKNTGTETLNVTIGTASVPFVVESGGGLQPLVAKAHVVVKVGFAPTTKGSFKAPLTITSDATKGTQIVKVTLKGIATGATPLPSPTPTATPTPTSDARIFVYVANYGNPDPDCSMGEHSTIAAYSADTNTGVLTLIRGGPFIAGCTPVSPVADPAGRFLYVPNQTNDPIYVNMISGFTINPSTGFLTAIPGSPFGNVPQAFGLAMDPSGMMLYAANFSSNGSGAPGAVSVFTIDQTTGALTQTPASPFSAGSTTSQTNAAAVDPLGNFLYVTNEGSNNLSGFSIDKTTGNLAALGGSPFSAPLHAAGTPSYLTIDSSGKFVYATNGAGAGAGGILGWTLDSSTGDLASMPGSPFPSDDYPSGLAINPKQPLLYVANQGSTTGTVSAYKIDAATGALTEIAGSPFDAGQQTNGVAIDATGKFLFASNAVNGSVSAYTINQTTGALTAVAGSPFMDGLYVHPFGLTAVNTTAH